jgi:hypothetical protein
METKENRKCIQQIGHEAVDLNARARNLSLSGTMYRDMQKKWLTAEEQ